MDFKFKKDGFINKNVSYTFGSKLYPMAENKKGTYITFKNTFELPVILKEQIDEALKGIEMPIGECYKNSEIILGILKKVLRGHKVEFYSGWCFIGPTYPLHHAFIMIDIKYIIDAGIRVEEYKLICTVICLSKNVDKVALANSIKELNKTIINKKFSEVYVCGQALKDICYYAAPDSYKNALNIGNYIVRFGVGHPSMVSSIISIQNGNHLQQLIRE